MLQELKQLESVPRSVSRVQMLILRTELQQVQFLLVLSPLVYIILVLLLPLKILLEQHLVSVNLIHKLMLSQPVLLA